MVFFIYVRYCVNAVRISSEQRDACNHNNKLVLLVGTIADINSQLMREKQKTVSQFTFVP
jgi:hypothetical protein